MLVCCTSNSPVNESPISGVINLQNALLEKKSFSYDSIISEMSVIKFENSKSSFIYKPKRFIVDSNGYIYILNGNVNILVFNAKGGFLYHIGDIGKGPGEYLSASDFCICKNDIICILSENKILRYGKNGEFINKIEIPNLRKLLFYPEFIADDRNNGFFIWDSNPSDVMNYKEDFYCLLHINDNGKIIEKKFPWTNFNIGISQFSHSYNGDYWIEPNEGYSELFKMKDEKVFNDFSLNFGKNLVSREYFKNSGVNPFSTLDEYFNSNCIKFINNIKDNDLYLYFTCVGDKYKWLEFLYDKDSKTTKIGILNEKNPIIVFADSSFFYSFFADNLIDDTLSMDNIFKKHLINFERGDNSYLFKFKLKK
jgi:hypothetical protein